MPCLKIRELLKTSASLKMLKTLFQPAFSQVTHTRFLVARRPFVCATLIFFEMKRLTLLLLLTALLGCHTKQSSPSTDSAGHVRAGNPEIYQTKAPVEGEQAPTWTTFPEDKIPLGCNQFSRCRAYTVVSYDANWHNEYGNEGLFVLRFQNVWITAHCGAKPGSCWHFVEAVGQAIWLDDEITDLLYFRTEREPRKEDAVLVVIKRSMEKPRS